MKYILCDHCEARINEGYSYINLFSLNYCSDTCMHRNINDLCYHFELEESDCDREDDAE